MAYTKYKRFVLVLECESVSDDDDDDDDGIYGDLSSYSHWTNNRVYCSHCAPSYNFYQISVAFANHVLTLWNIC